VQRLVSSSNDEQIKISDVPILCICDRAETILNEPRANWNWNC